jgi:crotonobetainyl-CoA:carnitine CoA-transferase CaiB-like acyl-CoA transferase
MTSQQARGETADNEEELMNDLPLEGIKVVDLTRYMAGPYCTMVLGDLGADVLKIERFPEGDDSRRLSPHINGESVCFAMANRNKRSVALDLKSDRGKDVLLRLVDDADVFVENFRPGVTARLGLDYETLHARRPELVYCSITGFGQTGPYAKRAGFDIIAQGVSGLMRMTGQPDGQPAKVGIAISDLTAGAIAVQAILGAYIRRLRTGEGQYIDISLVDSALSWTIWESAAYFGAGEIPAPTGTRHRRTTPYQAYRTADGYVTVGANNDRLWQRFCEQVVGRPEWLDDDRFRTLGDRLKHIDELEEEIESVFRSQPTAHWVEQLDAAGVPGGPVYTYDETLVDAHVRSRGMVQKVKHPIIGEIDTLGSPINYSETPLGIREPAPWLGQHTEAALAEAGVDREAVEALFEDGIAHDAQRAQKGSGTP